jgi:hypothetical protein
MATGSVGVGLGLKPYPAASLFNGTGGTAVVGYEFSNYANLMALRGQTLQEWCAVYLPGSPVKAVAFSLANFNNPAGCTSVKFSEVRILDVQHVGGAVEVTLQYGAVQRIFQNSRTGGQDHATEKLTLSWETHEIKA